MSNDNVKMFPQYDTELFNEVWEDATKFIYDYTHVGIPATISTQNATTLYYLLYSKYGNSPIANYDVTQWKYKVFGIIFEYGPTWEKRLSVQQTLRDLQLSDLIDDGSFSEIFAHDGSSRSTKSGTSGNTRTYEEDGTNTGTSTLGRTGTDTTASTGTQALARTGTVGISGQAEDIKNHALNPGTTPATNAYTALNYINDQLANKNTNSSTTTNNTTDTTTNNLQNQTTHATTDTTTNNLANSRDGRIVDSGTTSDTVSNTDEADDTRSRTLTVGKLAGYERLLALLETDVTNEFLNKFKRCFKQFVMPEVHWIYLTESEDEDEEE